MSTPFIFDPNLATAATIPASWYTDPAMLEVETARIFRRTWQYATTLDTLRFPGNYVAVEIIGIPIVLTRDLDGTLRAFYNVCRHRAGVVARGVGQPQNASVPVSRLAVWAGWRADATTPEFDGVANFDPCEFGLMPRPGGHVGPLRCSSI